MNIGSELFFKQDGLVRGHRRLDSRDDNKLPSEHHPDRVLPVDGDVSPRDWTHINYNLFYTFLHPQVCYTSTLSRKKQKDAKKIQKVSCISSI